MKREDSERRKRDGKRHEGDRGSVKITRKGGGQGERLQEGMGKIAQSSGTANRGGRRKRRGIP